MSAPKKFSTAHGKEPPTLKGVNDEYQPWHSLSSLGYSKLIALSYVHLIVVPHEQDCIVPPLVEVRVSWVPASWGSHRRKSRLNETERLQK